MLKTVAKSKFGGQGVGFSSEVLAIILSPRLIQGDFTLLGTSRDVFYFNCPSEHSE